MLRQHAARDHPVAERIRRGLPAFAGRTDREVLDARLSLAQAQQLVARESGFEDWAHLQRAIRAMPSTPSDAPRPAGPARPEILIAHPQILVTDMERAVAFYRDRLGFQVAYLYGEPPFYGLVKRDGVGLNLRHVDALPFDAETRAREDLLAVTLVVRNLKPLFVAFEEAGLAFHRRYRERPWGAHDFIVADPDGNLVHFASRPGEP